MGGVAPLLDALQLPPQQVHGQHLVLVTPRRPRADAGQRAQCPPRALLDEGVGVVGDVGRGERGGEAVVHQDDEAEDGEEVEEHGHRGPGRQPPRLLPVLVVVRVRGGRGLHLQGRGLGVRSILGGLDNTDYSGFVI